VVACIWLVRFLNLTNLCSALRKLKMMPDCDPEIVLGLESDVSACLDALRLLARTSRFCHRTYMVYKGMVEQQGYVVKVIKDDIYDAMDEEDERNGWIRQGDADLEIRNAMDLDMVRLQSKFSALAG
jgi:hypothetical protein